MICWVSVAPRPPYSFGQLIPTHPPACIFLCHSSRRFQSSALLSRMKSMPSSALPALGRFTESQLRNSERNASSSALNLKSIDTSRLRTERLTPGRASLVRQLEGRVPNTCYIEQARERIQGRGRKGALQLRCDRG